jgi:hypothetical protein
MDEGPQADRIIVARLMGAAGRHSRWEPPSEAVTAAAVAELREIAVGRSDLLAEVAGVLVGFREGTPDEPKARNDAEFCRLAGADEAQIPQWVAIGRDRAAQASQPPFGVKMR